MIQIISPSKTLDFTTKVKINKYTIPNLLTDSTYLVKELRKCSINDYTKLMNTSYGISETTIQNYKKWNTPFTLKNSKQCIFAYDGTTYKEMEAKNYSEDDLAFAQNSLRIISGLYGLLKPLDLIQPYRLTLNTKLNTEQGKNLYIFWSDKIINEINKTLKENKHKYIINLASNEYFKIFNDDRINAEIISPIFKQQKNGVYRVVSVYAKKARGLMSKFIIKNRLKKVLDVQSFDLDGYKYSSEHSTKEKFVFLK